MQMLTHYILLTVAVSGHIIIPNKDRIFKACQTELGFQEGVAQL